MHPDQQFALPFAERDEISVPRAMSILGVGRNAVQFMIDNKLFRATRRHATGNYLISYQSLVAYCDHLRLKYSIPDGRPQRTGIFGRFRDEELLPFPMSETMSVSEVAFHLRYSDQTVRWLCEEGKLCSYKLHDDGHWRINKGSLAKMCEQMRQMAS